MSKMTEKCGVVDRIFAQLTEAAAKIAIANLEATRNQLNVDYAMQAYTPERGINQ